MRKNMWILALGLGLTLAGIGAYRVYILSKRDLVSPKYGDVKETIYGLGVVEASEIFEYKLALTSTLKRAFVKEGDTVKKNQLLLSFHESPSLYAPFSGVITYLPFHEGENVFAQIVVLRLEDLSESYLEVTLEQQGALRVKPKQTARLSFESLRGSLFRGEVDSVYPSQGQFIVRIHPEPLPPEILPGMTADVAIEVAEKKQTLMVPTEAVMNGKIAVRREGKHLKIPVKLGSNDGTWVEVVDDSVRITDQIYIRKRE